MNYGIIPERMDNLKKFINANSPAGWEGHIYVAFPYLSENANIQHFRVEIAQKLLDGWVGEGFPVFSPVHYSTRFHARGINPPRGWYDWDMEFLKSSRELWVLQFPGWSDSIGVNLEIAVAKNLNIPIVYMDTHYMTNLLWNLGIKDWDHPHIVYLNNREPKE